MTRRGGKGDSLNKRGEAETGTRMLASREDTTVSDHKHSRRRLLGSALAGLVGFFFPGKQAAASPTPEGDTPSKPRPPAKTTTYVYEYNTRHIAVVDGLAGVTTATYDVEDRAVARRRDLGHTSTYVYDVGGRRDTPGP
jgi:hypothetical protein